MEENKIENSVLEENSNAVTAETNAENSTSDTKDVDNSTENSEIKTEETMGYIRKERWYEKYYKDSRLKKS